MHLARRFFLWFSQGNFAGGGGIGSGLPVNELGVAVTELGTAVKVLG